MEIIGRLTADATVKTLSNEKQVVNFTLAVNETYRKNGETKKLTSYFNCAYWKGVKVAAHLTKGSLLSLYGNVSVSSYIDMQGEAQAVLHFHTNEIKIISKSKHSHSEPIEEANSTTNETIDDLPF